MPIVCKNFSELQKNVLIEALTFMRDFDKKKTPEKFEFLKIQALKCGFDLRKIKSKSSLNSADLTLLINKIDNITIKRYIILQMILITIAAHELSDIELDLIYGIGTKVGISVDKIDDFFLWAAKGVEWQIEGAKIVEEDL